MDPTHATNSVTPTTLPVADIVVGPRARKAMEKIAELQGSIARVGLLQPVVVNTRHELIAGGRRLEAVKRLGWVDVPVRVVDGLDDAVAALRAEYEENVCRVDFTLSEMVELGKRVEAMEKERAKRRQKEGGRAGGKASGKLPEASPQVRDKVAKALGVSGRTFEKAKAVVEAAEREPEKYGDLPAKMDATGKVDPVHKELKYRREEVQIPVSPDSKEMRTVTIRVAESSREPITVRAQVIQPAPEAKVVHVVSRSMTMEEWQEENRRHGAARIQVYNPPCEPGPTAADESSDPDPEPLTLSGVISDCIADFTAGPAGKPTFEDIAADTEIPADRLRRIDSGAPLSLDELAVVAEWCGLRLADLISTSAADQLVRMRERQAARKRELDKAERAARKKKSAG